MSRRAHVFALVVSVLCARVAEAQPTHDIVVVVTDVAGGRVYVTPGEEAGVRPGTIITIAGVDHPVLGATRESAVIAASGVELDTAGIAHVVDVAPDATPTGGLSEVVPLDRYRDQWPRASVPAEDQHPAFVPLGPSVYERRYRLTLTSSTTGYVPLSGGHALLRQQLRATVHAEPFAGVPFAIDANATLQLYAARDLSQRPGSDSRPILRVQQAQLSYGRDREFYAALGRLATAASGVGMLDGVRLRSPTMRGFRLGAFGGLVPGLFDNVPSFRAGRFGVEATYEGEASDVRPTVSLVAQGSIYDGRIDERRLTGAAYLMPDIGRFGAYVSVDAHDRDNPWNAKAVEVSAAGAEGALRSGPWRGGVRFDYRRPERTRWLASQLPVEWLCGGLGTTTVPCDVRNDGRYFVSADASYARGHVAVAGGGSYIRTPASAAHQGSAFAQVRIVDIRDVARVSVTASGYGGSLLRSYAIATEAATSLADDRVDVGLHYRPSVNLYAAEASATVSHLVGGSVRYAPRRDLSAGCTFDALLGPDVGALLVQVVLAWRPELE